LDVAKAKKDDLLMSKTVALLRGKPKRLPELQTGYRLVMNQFENNPLLFGLKFCPTRAATARTGDPEVEC
jgi:hypothetical protein